jgi:hypothetical protein
VFSKIVMAKKRSNEFREKKLERDGLKQRRLKEESRWRYNPSSFERAEYGENKDEWDDYEEEYKY